MLAAGADPRYASPGVLGFMVIFVLAVATWLLVRSMVGHLRKVRYGAQAPEQTDPGAGTPPGEERPGA